MMNLDTNHTSERIRGPAATAGQWLARAAVLLALLLHGPVAQAEDADTQKVRSLFQEGERQYRIAQFDKALASFEAALKLLNSPSIILNVAQCHRQLKNHDKALFFYRLYITEWRKQKPDKDLPFAEEVQTHIKSISAELKEAHPAERQEERPPHRSEQEQSARELGLSGTHAGQPEARTPFYKAWWFWTIVGAVVVGTAATATAVSLMPEDQSPVSGTLGDKYLD